MDKLEKCDKFIMKCKGLEAQAVPEGPAPPPVPAPPPQKPKTVTTVVILSSDDEDCAIVDEKTKKDQPSTSKSFKSPSPPSSSNSTKKENEPAIPPGITQMEILSLIDELREKQKPVQPEVKPVLDTGISLISSEESDSWSKEQNEGGDKDEERAKRKARKLKKKEQRKREKIEALKEKLNSKEKNIVELKKKLGYCSDSSISSVDSLTPKVNKNKSKLDDSLIVIDSPSKEVELEDIPKQKSETELIEDIPKDEEKTAQNTKEPENPTEEKPSKSYVTEPLIIKQEDDDDCGVIFTRRPKKEKLEVKEVPPVVNTNSLPEPPPPVSTDIYKQLNHLLMTEVGVNMEDFLDIMKTDKFEIKKEIIAKVLNCEEPPPAPRFQKPMEEEPPPPPPIKLRDPRVSQEINLNVNLNMPPSALFNNDPRNHHTLNLNISTSSGMQLGKRLPPMNIPPPPPPLNYPNNHIQMPPSPVPDLRDPRLRRAQPNPLLPSPPINHSPIMNSPEYSPRDFIPKPSFPPVTKNPPSFDKRAALTYGEYKKRKALEEQQKKKLELQALLSEVESKSAEAVRQLHERQQILEPNVAVAKPPVVEKPISKPVVEYIKPSDLINKDHDEGDEEEEDDDDSDMDEVTKLNTMRNRELKNSQTLSQVKEPVVEYVKPSETNGNDDDSDMDEATAANTKMNRKPTIDGKTDDDGKVKTVKVRKPLNSMIIHKKKVPTPKSSPETSENNKPSTSKKKSSAQEKDVDEKIAKNGMKSFREVIKLQSDIIQSFMPNDVLQNEYGLHRSRNNLNDEDYVEPKRIMTRRKSSCIARKEDVSPPPAEKIKKRRKTTYITKKEKAEKKEDKKKKTCKKEEEKVESEKDSDWHVEQKVDPPPVNEPEKKPKINLILRKRGEFFFCFL